MKFQSLPLLHSFESWVRKRRKKNHCFSLIKSFRQVCRNRRDFFYFSLFRAQECACGNRCLIFTRAVSSSSSSIHQEFVFCSAKILSKYFIHSHKLFYLLLFHCFTIPTSLRYKTRQLFPSSYFPTAFGVFSNLGVCTYNTSFPCSIAFIILPFYSLSM